MSEFRIEPLADVRLTKMLDLLTEETSGRIDSPGYEQCFMAIWRKRYREFLKVHPDTIEGCVRAEWQRFQRGELAHWDGWEE